MTQYVLQDRSLATKWALSIANGELKYTSTVATASADPIVDDYLNTGTYWKIFIDDGELAYESTATVQNDSMLFNDSVAGSIVQLAISDGEMVMIPYVTAPIVRAAKNRVVRYSVVSRIKRFERDDVRRRYSNTPKVCI